MQKAVAGEFTIRDGVLAHQRGDGVHIAEVFTLADGVAEYSVARWFPQMGVDDAFRAFGEARARGRL